MRKPKEDAWERKYNDLLQEYDALMAAHEDITAFLAEQASRASSAVSMEHERLASVFDGVARQYENNIVQDADKLTPAMIFSMLSRWLREGAGVEADTQPKADARPNLHVVRPPAVKCPDCIDGADADGWQCLRCRGTGKLTHE